MWTLRWRSRSQWPAAAALLTVSPNWHTEPPRSSGAASLSQTHQLEQGALSGALPHTALGSTASTAAFTNTLPLLNKREVGGKSSAASSFVESPPQPSSSLTTNAATSTDDRTTELLRSIAQRGGGTVRRAGRDARATASNRGASTAKSASPLARLFAAPPPAAAASSVKTNVRKPPASPSSSINPTSEASAPRSRISDPTHRKLKDAHQPPLSPPPSRRLLEKLLQTIGAEKRVQWDAVARLHPEVAQMPLYACRDEWTLEMKKRCSATPLASKTAECTTGNDTGRAHRISSTLPPPPPPPSPSPLFLSAAPTGTGKSVLLPLFALDAHWAALEERLQHTLAMYDVLVETRQSNEKEADQHGRDTSSSSLPSSALQPFSLSSQAHFIRDFTACSLLCIVVSQPTRVACAELARYTSALLAPPHQPSPEPSGIGDEERRQLLGKRVGYAVGGEPRFCAETELIYATPGYVLNAMLLAARTAPPSASRASALSPTTLMVDEAHCRDLETDALLAWVKLARDGRTLGDAPRQFCVMSATMNLAAMDDYLACATSWNDATRDATTGRDDRFTPRNLLGEVALSPHSTSAAPVLLFSPAQQQHVQQWWVSVDSVASRVGGWAAEMQRDRQLRRTVLRLVEATEGEACDPGDGLAPASQSPTASPSSWPLGRTGGDTGVAVGSAASPPIFHSSANATSADLDGELPQGIVVSVIPHRVERFFMDDLDPSHGCFAQSRVLFDAATRRAAATARAKTAHARDASVYDGPGTSAAVPAAPLSSSRPYHSLPLCLSEEGETQRVMLGHVFNTRPSSYQLFNHQARLVAGLVLQLLQAARLRWISPSTPSSENAVTGTGSASARTTSPSTEDSTAPVTILVFVAGLAEMYQVLQALEHICERVQLQESDPAEADVSAAPSSTTAASQVEMLRNGSEVFSVGLLHASAVGNPQEQLAATAKAGAPLRLLLTTNVAENSLTIPNTRIVLDTCLERRVRADDTTGTTRVMTAFASPSGLRQRCGRVGRTCDGVVIHLAPRRFVLPPAERETARLPRPAPALIDPSDAESRLRCHPIEPLAEGVATVLLRMKYLFPDVPAALAALPSPPSTAELRIALQQLVDMEVLVLPEAAPRPRDEGSAQRELEATSLNASTWKPGDGDATSARLSPSLNTLLNESKFTAKGLLMASLPLPLEHTALVYYGLQFLCVEDALLMACAMSVPTLFTIPRVSAHSLLRVAPRKRTDSGFTWSHATTDMKAALSPLETFYKRLWMQRDLAGFSCPPSSSPHNAHERDSKAQRTTTTNASGGAPSSVNDDGECVGHLSEPLLLRAVLRRWYALSSSVDTTQVLNDCCVNRAALRQVDSMVEQCCSRLVRLLLQRRHSEGETKWEVNAEAERWDREGSEVDEGDEQDFGAYVCDGQASSPGNDSSSTLPFLDEWPQGLQNQLLRSLRRLQRAAHSRVHLRAASRRYRSGLPQWHDSEEPRIRLCSQPYVPAIIQQRRGANKSGEERGEASDKDKADQRERAIRRHPSFAYWDHHHLPLNGGSINSQKLPYPSLPLISTVSTAASAATCLTGPPPLRTHLTRARSPVYRPPPPPLEVPPVAFLLGRTEDRLCAAFVAAFGHRTMRGEDGGHRYHHRRLVRNLQTLEHDSDHVCTFHIDVQQQPSRSITSSSARQLRDYDSNSVAGEENKTVLMTSSAAGDAALLSPPPASSSYDGLEAAGVTPEGIRAALEPYLAGAGLRQLEVFKSNRLAVAARFATSGFEGLPMMDRTEGGGAGRAASPAERTVSEDDEDDARGGDDGRESERRVLQHRQSPPVRFSGVPCEGSTTLDATARAPSSTASPLEKAADANPLLRPLPLSSLCASSSCSALREETASRELQKRGPTTTLPLVPLSKQQEHRSASGNPYVQLAPFGVSLLIAAASGGGGGGGLGGLQRIPLPITAVPHPASTTSTSDAVPAAARSFFSAPTSTHHTTASVEAGVNRGLRFSSDASPHAPHGSSWPSSVSWSDLFGTFCRSLKREEVDALGLGDLYPTPAPPARPPSSSHVAVQPSSKETFDTRSSMRSDEATTVGQEAAFESSSSSSPSLGHTTLQSSPLTLSVVPPVYIARSITWKVPLPTTIALPHATHTQGGSRSCATSSPPPRTSLHYCVLCQQLCSTRYGFENHCRSLSHLDHLFRAVQLGLSRTQLEEVYGYPSRRPHHEDGRGEDKQRNETSSRSFSETARSRHIWNPNRPQGAKQAFSSSSSLSTVVTAAMPLLSLFSIDHNGSNTQAGSAAASDKRLHAASPVRLLTQQLHPCVINALSFLNCLQWTPRRTAPAPSTTTIGDAADTAAATEMCHDAPTAMESADSGDCATPLAVAGGLVAMQGAMDILAPPHLRGHATSNTASTTSSGDGERNSGALPAPLTVSASTLSAQHVWVLNVSSGTTKKHSSSPSSPSSPPTALLFVLAGYLAAASPQAMVSLLFNAAHTHLHGVMLYGLGSWKLPEPLPMHEYAGVLEHMAKGNSWPGLLIPVVRGRAREACAQQQQPPQRHQPDQRAGVYEGLHWCTPTGTCEMCNSAATGAASSGESLQEHWPMMEATILLVLQEYVQTRRNMVTLAGFVERVLRKLQHSPFMATPSSSSSSASAASVSGARLFAHYMTHARGGQGIQSLLRDVGCTFVSPPHALAALISTGDASFAPGISADAKSDWKEASTTKTSRQAWGKASSPPPSGPKGDDTFSASSSTASAWSKRLSTRALGAEGAVVEVMFAVPPILPSALPPVDFSVRLRSFFERRHAVRWKRGETSNHEHNTAAAQHLPLAMAHRHSGMSSANTSQTFAGDASARGHDASASFLNKRRMSYRGKGNDDFLF